VRVVVALALIAACNFSSSDGPKPDATEPSPDAMADAAIEPIAGELRGVWITRFAFSTRAQLEAVIDRAAAAHFNAVFVQIRAEGDAYYNSSIEPWAKRLTGTLGRDPGWDPLQVAIDRAHMHGMELHAYFNVFSATAVATPVTVAEGTKQHALYTNPDWLAVESDGMNGDTEYRWLSPGIPAVRAHNTAVARDLLTKYAVDGLHLDRIRVAGPDYSRDAVTVAAYDAAKAANPALTWADFMRAQVSQQVADIHAALMQVRPKARLSAAVWGIYQPIAGCSTSQGYANYYQDSLAWLAAGTMDALAPMVYWPIEPGACTDWAKLVDGFVAARAGRQIWAGMHALDANVWTFPAVRSRIELSRTNGAHGTVVFASAYLEPDRWTAFSEAGAPYADVVPTPAMAWKP
jgi:uncharacterized lipoprotein YddW (UPF0748 family)